MAGRKSVKTSKPSDKVVRKRAPRTTKRRAVTPKRNAAQGSKGKFQALFTNEPDPLTVEPTQPLIQAPVQKESAFLDAIGTQLDNEYDEADLIVLKDDRLRGNLELFSQMVGRAYQGIDVTQEGDQENPRELSEQELLLLQGAQELDNRLDFKRLMQSYSKFLFKYGDVIDHIETDPEFLDEEFDEDLEASDTVTGLTNLPINQITIIDEQGRIDEPEPERVITQANFYVVDELNADQTEEDPVVYEKAEILHISMDNRGNWKEDLIARNTFGIWSDAPLKSIKYLIEWKHALIRNDMLWRNKMLPREHHMLNMTAFAPENYPGASFSARLSAAKIAATAEMNLYAASVRRQQPDQGYVTSTDVAIEIIEPKTVKYTAINEQIDQIDSKISSMTGTPAALSGGTNSSFSSVEFSGTFVSLRAEEMSALIARGLERVVWKHLKALVPSAEIADIKRVKLKTKLILDRDLTERSKVVSILAGTAMFTATEIRDVFGLEALTDKQSEEIEEFMKMQSELKSPAEVTGDALKQTTDPGGEGKQKRINDNNSQGDRLGER